MSYRALYALRQDFHIGTVRISTKQLQQQFLEKKYVFWFCFWEKVLNVDQNTCHHF